MSSNRDFAVEQIFRADDFRADDPSPSFLKTYLFKLERVDLLPINIFIQT